jgi:predicted phage tail component-like protein
VLPAIRQQYETIPGKHGSYNFSDGTLEDRIIEIECTFAESSIGDLRYKARQLASWLYTKETAPLIFDDEPDLFYMARIANQIDIEQTASLGVFTLQFRCEPFAYFIEDAASSSDLDSPTIMYRNLRLDDKFAYSVTNPITVEVNNFGTFETPPVIQVDGSFTTLSITVGGTTFNYTEALSNDTLIIDNERLKVMVGSTNKLNKVTGNFITLPVGINQVTIGGTGLNCTVYFLFNPRYL